MLAIMAPGPIHVASDSQVATIGFEFIISYIKETEHAYPNVDHYEEWPMYKRWGQVRDGDPWEHACNMIIQTIPMTSRLSEVKAHVTDAYTEGDGHLKQYTQLENVIVYEVVDEGVEEHVPGVVKIAAYFARRQRIYGRLIPEVQKMMLDVLKLTMEETKRERQENIANPAGRSSPTNFLTKGSTQ